jgi:hypothetical protein|tara:strand:- start:2480 stop:2626 length:147 start_codon:yes stop_codon:yes gene_type:complete
VKIFKKNQNCLFIEEEHYNWASPKPSGSKKLLGLSILFVVSGLLFSVL